MLSPAFELKKAPRSYERGAFFTEDRLGSALFDGSLRGGQTGDGHTEGGAGNIVQAHTVAELHRGGIAAVLTADAQMQVGVSGTAQLGSHLDQTAHALLVQLDRKSVV